MCICVVDFRDFIFEKSRKTPAMGLEFGTYVKSRLCSIRFLLKLHELVSLYSIFLTNFFISNKKIQGEFFTRIHWKTKIFGRETIISYGLSSYNPLKMFYTY